MAGVGRAASDGLIIGHESGRYHLRPPQPDDADAYVLYLQRNWPRFRGAMPTATEATFAPETYRQRFSAICTTEEQPKAVSLMLFAHRDSQNVVGDVTFSNLVFGAFQACHLGFKIDESVEGIGVMRRALEISCDLVFARFGLHRIMANYRPENVRSGALLKRLGFQAEGFAREYLHLDGEWRDHVLTSLVKPC